MTILNTISEVCLFSDITIAVYEVPDSVLYLEIQPQHYLTFTFAPFLEIIVKEIFTIIIKINSTKPIANNA